MSKNKKKKTFQKTKKEVGKHRERTNHIQKIEIDFYICEY